MHNYANESLLIWFFRKIIFTLQITIDRVHTVQILSRYSNNVKNAKNSEKTINAKATRRLSRMKQPKIGSN